ncbi:MULTISPECIES: LysR family transcriptional regulator [Sphingobium]|uniref:LysR family transcriptional regulator n=1 Tax=Sphingobium TaxID=165695 RepID=UPI00159C8D71|nr:LysR family transcriptional regulator [Sphingobium sp. 15-1]
MVIRDELEPVSRGGLSERRLGYLYAAVEAKSIRGAADKLSIEPSVISRQIQLLERELDTVLLDRHGRGVLPTEAARLVLDFYRRRVSDEKTMLTQLEELKGLQRGDVQIACSEGFIEAVIETVLNDFCVKYPNVQITLNSMPVASVMRLIAEERINIGLAFAPPPHNAVEIHARKRHPLYVIARHDHPLARQEGALTLQNLLNQSLCLVPPEFGIGQLIKSAEHTAQVDLPRTMITNSLEALRHFVTSGLGLTILPKILVQRQLETGLVKTLRIRNASLEAAEAQLVVPPRRIKSIAETAVLKRLAALSWFQN